MKVTTAIASILLGAGTFTSIALAQDYEPRDVYTMDGVVRFVSVETTAEDLAEYLFADSTLPKSRTRSLFSGTKKPVADNNQSVSVAFLIQFEFDSAELTKETKSRLGVIGDMLKMKALVGRRLTVEGHTDVVGNSNYNLGLSLRRAESVKQYLVSDYGIESGRLLISGKGERQLIDLDNPKSAANRRVQFSVVKNSTLSQ